MKYIKGFLTEPHPISCFIWALLGFTLLGAIVSIFGEYSQYIIGVILIVAVIFYINHISEESAERKEAYKSYYRRFHSSDYPENWDEITAKVRARDGHKCGNCGSTTNLDVHHIVPKSRGGTNELSNLRTLCHDCHKKIHPHLD
jgi:5-methylcytosine-specific restriction endonuclease McrA